MSNFSALELKIAGFQSLDPSEARQLYTETKFKISDLEARLKAAEERLKELEAKHARSEQRRTLLRNAGYCAAAQARIASLEELIRRKDEALNELRVECAKSHSAVFRKDV